MHKRTIEKTSSRDLEFEIIDFLLGFFFKPAGGGFCLLLDLSRWFILMFFFLVQGNNDVLLL